MSCDQARYQEDRHWLGKHQTSQQAQPHLTTFLLIMGLSPPIDEQSVRPPDFGAKLTGRRCQRDDRDDARERRSQDGRSGNNTQ